MLYKFMKNGEEIVLNQSEYDSMRVLQTLDIDFTHFRICMENEYTMENLKRWIKMIATQNKIEAIKFVRVLTDWDLKTSKDFVEAL